MRTPSASPADFSVAPAFGFTSLIVGFDLMSNGLPQAAYMSATAQSKSKETDRGLSLSCEAPDGFINRDAKAAAKECQLAMTASSMLVFFLSVRIASDSSSRYCRIGTAKLPASL